LSFKSDQRFAADLKRAAQALVGDAFEGGASNICHDHKPPLFELSR